jgi:hypothetical protein
VVELKDIARSAATEAAPRDGVGGFVEVVDEGEFVSTFRFESKLKGYRDWRWNVVIFAPEGQEPTVSEVLLMPGPDSLIAPDWVPWSERLADYKALQAELEAQAALDAEDEDADEDSEDEVEDEDLEGAYEDDPNAGLNDGDATEVEGAENSALSDPTEPEQAENDADTAGKRPKRLFGWRKPRVSKKNKK